MRYSSHRIAGICVGLGAATIISQGDIGSDTLAMAETLVITSMVGAILPDIDEPNSFVSKHVKPVSHVIKAVAGHRGAFHAPLFLGLLLFLLKIVVDQLVGADLFASVMKVVVLVIPVLLFLPYIRSKGAVFLVASVVLLIVSHNSMEALATADFYWYLWLGLALGMASHLLMDALTVSGIPLLWPFTKKKFHILSLKTGQHEGIAQAIFIIPTVLLMLWYFAEPLANLLSSLT